MASIVCSTLFGRGRGMCWMGVHRAPPPLRTCDERTVLHHPPATHERVDRQPFDRPPVPRRDLGARLQLRILDHGRAGEINDRDIRIRPHLNGALAGIKGPRPSPDLQRSSARNRKRSCARGYLVSISASGFQHRESRNQRSRYRCGFFLPAYAGHDRSRSCRRPHPPTRATAVPGCASLALAD